MTCQSVSLIFYHVKKCFSGKEKIILMAGQTVFMRGFSAEECIKCGKGIAGCPYTDMIPGQARGVMKKAAAMPVKE